MDALILKTAAEEYLLWFAILFGVFYWFFFDAYTNYFDLDAFVKESLIVSGLIVVWGAIPGRNSPDIDNVTKAKIVLSISVFVFFIILKLHRKLAKENRARLDHEEYQRAKKLESYNLHQIEQKRIYAILTRVCDDALESFESMPSCLLSAEEHLDLAEAAFESGAFAPFWDSVEQATQMLGKYGEKIRKIKTHVDEYAAYAKRLEESPPPFSIVPESVTSMSTSNTSSDRLRSIVGKAQRNFQFATIYEQRRTNQLLVAGFKNLAQALDGIGFHIQSSIEDLNSTMKVQQFSNQKYEESRVKRHEQIVERLNNIQGRRSSPK